MTMVNPFAYVFVLLGGVTILYLVFGGILWCYGVLGGKPTIRHNGGLLAATSFLPPALYGGLYLFIWPFLQDGVGFILYLVFLGLALPAMAAPLAVVVRTRRENRRG